MAVLGMGLGLLNPGTMRSSSYERIPDDQGHIEETRPREVSHYTDDERPPIYYGEGPFDPPSSEDESVDDKEGEAQAPGEVEDDDVELQLSATLRKVCTVFFARLCVDTMSLS